MAKVSQHKRWSADVKRKLFLDGVSVVKLAEQIGFHRNSVYRAINHGKYRRVMEAIGKEVGIPL